MIEYFVNTITTLYQNYTKHPIIFIAVTEKSDLKPNILRIFLEKFNIPKLKLKERHEMLQWFASVMDLKFCDIQENTQSNNINLYENSALDPSVNDILQRIAAKTETFLYGDMDTLVHFALRESYLKQHAKNKELTQEINLSNVQEDDFNSALGN